MLEVAKFLVDLGKTVSCGIGGFREVRDGQREKQSKYLDSISETLASTGVATVEGQSITKQIAELRFHLKSLKEVLKYNEPLWEMSLADEMVDALRTELDKVLKETPNCVPGESERRVLSEACFQAAGVFRGAAVAMRGRI